MGLWEKLRLRDAVRVNDSVKDDKVSRILRYIRKFAVDSAVDDSLNGVADGVLVDKIVKKGPKDLNTSRNLSNKLDLVVADEMRARIEKMQEHAKCEQLQTAISTQSRQLLDCFEDLPKKPIKGSNSSKTTPKRIMIRSRL